MDTVFEIELRTEKDLDRAAEYLLEFAGSVRTVLFYAPMGAGKTTVIKALCRRLGSSNALSSPSYSIVNEYASPKGKIYHFDLYRLKDPSELLDLGIEEYLDSGHYCFFEWPALVENFIAAPYIRVEMEVNEKFRYLRAFRNTK